MNVIEGHLKNLVAPFEEYHKWIEPTVTSKLSERLEKNSKDAQLASQLKYPLKKRESATLTYKVPEITRNLRFHFLVQLNGQYEGMATGENFNYQEKTDILIKYNRQNLFVGECKFWKG